MGWVWRVSRILERVSCWLLMSVTSASRLTATGSWTGGGGGLRLSPFPDGSMELGSERFRERGTTVESVVLLEREELDLVLFRMEGREADADRRLDRDLWLWFEM